MEKETSCINTRAVIDYVKEYNNGDLSDLLTDLDPEIDSLQNPENYLSDPNNWVSCNVVSELHKRARVIFKDDLTAFRIAKYSIVQSSLGYVQKIVVKALWSYKQGLKHVQKINDKWNRSKRVELVDIKSNEAKIRLHWVPEMEVTKDICLYNQGIYVFMPLIWGGEPLILEEVDCYFEGADYCEYRLKWPAKNRYYEIFSRFLKSKSVLADTIIEMEADKQLIERKYEEVNVLNEELQQKIKQLQAIQETGKAILSVLDLEQLLTVIMNTLSNVCHISRAIVMLVNKKENRLEYIYGIGFDSNVLDEVNNYAVPLDRVNNILVRVSNTGQPEYVPNVKDSSLRKDNLMITYGKPASVFVVPLITRSKVIGVIATDAVDSEGVPKETRDTLEVFAPQIAIAMENARLYNSLQKQMLDLKQSHALLSRAEKFSFLGNLAARLAHEIKNPMTAIGTFMQMLPYKYNDEDFRVKFYSIAMEETERVNNLISELLDLVKTKESCFELSDIHQLIKRMVLLVSPQTNAKKITVNCIFDESIGHLWLDPEKMKQVILNILSNAVDSMPEGGMVELSTKICNNSSGKKETVIKMKDNGTGIPSDIIEKIFDPYFTTKHKSNMHNGTGLGLFISHQNIEGHGGTIEVNSSVNEGAEFIITLPFINQEEQSGN